MLSGLREHDLVVVGARANLRPGLARRAETAGPDRTRRRPLMPGFSIRKPYLILVICLMVAVVGTTTVARMPVDLFPDINIPVVVVATFFSGMPPEQIEADITGRFERFFTLASNIEHIESRSLPGVSLIKIYFQPGTNSDSAVTNISNLAMANLRRLPPGTLPPVVLKFDASSLPVCLITLKGEGLNETQLRDLAQYAVRNQVANVRGASVPQPFGGKYRQIMIYVDPLKLEAHQLSPMDVVRAVNDSNLILPAGDVRIGPLDYSIYTNSQVEDVAGINEIPLKTVGHQLRACRRCRIGAGRAADPDEHRPRRRPAVGVPAGAQARRQHQHDFGRGRREGRGLAAARRAGPARDSGRVRPIAVRQRGDPDAADRDGRRSGADVRDCAAVPVEPASDDGRPALGPACRRWPRSWPSRSEAARSTRWCSGGLALAFTRLLFNSLVVLENIFRHLDAGESPEVAAERGGREVAMPVMAATLTTIVVFFPGDVSVRREPLSVWRAGDRRRARAPGVVRRGAVR